MKRHIFRTLTLLAATATISVASAQDTRTGYFLDEYTYRYQMNPAIGNEKNFVSMPALGNLNIGMHGTLHVTSLLYNVDGRTTTFMNPAISAKEALGKFNNSNRIGVNLKLNILSGGFKAWGGYNTVSINARADVGARLPKSIFSLLKEGVSNKTYDISGVRANANAYAELAFGHSRNITSEWRVGATVKFLFGAGNIDANLKRARLSLGEDSWDVVSNAEINGSVKGLHYKTDVNNNTGSRYVSGAEIDGYGLSGFGLGFDLGAVYKPDALKDWEFSAGLLDLGFIHWSQNALATTGGDKYFRTDQYTFNTDEDAPNSFSKEWDRMSDAISALYELEDKGHDGGRTTSLATTFNIGAKYTLPIYRPLTFGLLNTTRIQGNFSWTDFRISANVAPCKVFSASASFDAGTFGCGFGWLLNLHVTGFNMFLGMDHTLGRLAKQGIPLNSNGSVNLGMDFLF